MKKQSGQTLSLGSGCVGFEPLDIETETNKQGIKV